MGTELGNGKNRKCKGSLLHYIQVLFYSKMLLLGTAVSVCSISSQKPSNKAISNIQANFITILTVSYNKIMTS